MKIDVQELSRLFNEADNILNQYDTDELHELLSADDVKSKIQAHCFLSKPTPERIEAIRQMLFGGHEKRIGRA